MAAERRILPTTPGREGCAHGGPPAQVDYFISYTSSDRAWAEWIAWQLEAAGSTTVLQAWDFRPGSDFIHQMQQAVQQADRTIAVVSSEYFGSQFGEAEWRVAFGRDPTGESGVLVPVRVEDCDPPGLLSTRVYVDLVGLDEATARRRLLADLRQGDRPRRPATAPVFPGRASSEAGVRPAPEFPGPGPAVSNLAPLTAPAAEGQVERVAGRVSNLPPPNPDFTGRRDLLDQLDRQLATSGRAAVVAAHGLGGVGKTQLVLAYAHEHAEEYPLVWWIPAETDLGTTSALAALAPLLGVRVEADQEATVAAVLQALGRRNGPAGGPTWLLVFDNAEDPERLRRLLPPGGSGRVLVTSRNPAWGGLARRVEVDVPPEDEAVTFLLEYTASTDRAAAVALARELDRLPLALAQVAGYCVQTGLSLAEYLDAYQRRRDELLAKGLPAGYPATVATTWQLSVDQLAGRSPGAVQLLRLAAFLAPEGIPVSLLAADPQQLPDELAAAVQDEAALEATVGALVGLSLVARERGGLRLHRLVQAATQANLPADQAARWAERAVRLIGSAFPDQPEDPQSWPHAAGLLAHAVAAADHADTRQAAPEATGGLRNQVGLYLLSRGEFAAAREQLERALTIQEAANGPDHPQVARTLANLGHVLAELRELPAAREQLERVLRIEESAYGPDHPHVAHSLIHLGIVLNELGESPAAREQLERALTIQEAANGPDHPQVAATLANLDEVLQELGDKKRRDAAQ